MNLAERPSASSDRLLDPDTPFLAVDQDKVVANIARLNGHLAQFPVSLRPHVKTAKSVDLTRLLFDGATGPIAVSTMAEAEAFAAAGFSDILYAVGISPAKLDRVLSLRAQDVDLVVLLDSVEQATAVAAASRTAGIPIPVLIEVDCDGHRGGVRPDDPALLEIATAVVAGAELRGVLVHAGESYFCDTEQALVAAAEAERVAAAAAAQTLRAAGHSAPVVSVGSTPTAHFARDLCGVTEVRAGNFVFFDLVMAGIGVCVVEDLALSVVTTVIGHQREKGWIITDGGWMATSRDRGTARQRVDQGYGLVADVAGRVYPDLLMSDASQEHGILSTRPGSLQPLPDLPVGSRVRILPNHACATASQHDSYNVISADEATIWSRVRGW